ncbi:MAG: hypothetical protein J5858_03840 [Lentisphaeria bacterium]|nr:hypothetical protein [Lentisphaeria bacterium]
MPFERFEKVLNWSDFYYRRPWGKEPCFHVTAQNEIQIIKSSVLDRYLYRADMNEEGMHELAVSVNLFKLAAVHSMGGIFSINEYGTVIVPAYSNYDGYAIAAVGRWTGDMYFLDDDGSRFSLGEDFELGDPWPYSYLGMKYNLSKTNSIYRVLDPDEGEQCEPLLGYDSLIHSLRRIRPYGPMTFLVNPFGCVLAKKVEGDEFPACYVCKLDYDQWFPDPLQPSAAKELSREEIQDTVACLNRKRNYMTKQEQKFFDALLQIYWANGKTLNEPDLIQNLLKLKKRYLTGE